MPVDRVICRQAANECIELARVATNPATKQALLDQAQKWIKLAYSGNDAELVKAVATLNDQQMSWVPFRRQMQPQQQPLQQQQQAEDGRSAPRGSDRSCGTAG
jgi:hypothetical protein